MAVKEHWFHSKSPAAKKAYIAAHPNSVYAKAAKMNQDKKKAGAATKSPEYKKLKEQHDIHAKAQKVAYKERERAYEDMEKLRKQRDRKTNPISSQEFKTKYAALVKKARAAHKAKEAALKKQRVYGAKMFKMKKG